MFGLLVGVQLAPEKDFSRYDELAALGVDHLSFCVELLDPEWFARICPGKARVHGQQLYFAAMQYAAALLPRGAVSGEIIAGIEPVEQTIAAVDRITALGAFPTVCIFRPTAGSDMESWPPPDYEAMRRVMARVYDACRAQWLPIGAAPNIEVSLVVTPTTRRCWRRTVRGTTRTRPTGGRCGPWRGRCFTGGCAPPGRADCQGPGPGTGAPDRCQARYKCAGELSRVRPVTNVPGRRQKLGHTTCLGTLAGGSP